MYRECQKFDKVEKKEEGKQVNRDYQDRSKKSVSSFIFTVQVIVLTIVETRILGIE